MNLSPLEIALIAGAFTIIGAWIGYRSSISLHKIIEFNKAVSDFRNAFLPEIIFLKHNAKIDDAGSSDDIHEFLSYGYIHRHLKAFEIFRNYLSSKESRGIDEAWIQYCHDKDNSIALYYKQFATEGKKPNDEIESEKELILKRIEKVLSFAQHK